MVLHALVRAGARDYAGAMSAPPFPLPPDIERALRGREHERVAVGQSRADVFRFDGGLYLKSVVRSDADPCFGKLDGERGRLEWLDGKLPVPAVVAFARDERRDHLVLSEVAGQHAGADVPSPSAMPAVIEELAAACQLFHSISAHACPFRESAGDLIEQARGRLDAGLVDAEDFDDERQGHDPRALFEDLVALRPMREQQALCHGDLCLPNLILRDDKFAGFVDLGRAGVADRWRDIALCAHDIGERWGAAWGERFVELCGGDPRDPARSFYVLLDEFF
jgi:aminoglycoside phosphotransferase